MSMIGLIGCLMEERSAARLIVMYKPPKDRKSFDQYCRTTHVPLAKKMPGLRKLELSRSSVATAPGAPAYHLVAVLHFDSMAAIMDALASAEGRSVAADLGNFADGGAEMLFFDASEA